MFTSKIKIKYKNSKIDRKRKIKKEKLYQKKLN